MADGQDAWEPGRRVLAGGARLDLREAEELFSGLLPGPAVPAEGEAAATQMAAARTAATRMSAVLGALAVRGVRAEELAGFAEALRVRAVPVPLSEAERNRLVDTCGTGGDGGATFNLSTGAALLAAAAGATVAKHGNRAITSRCGSADVLEALGIRVDHTPESAAASLRRYRFAFLAAPRFHPALAAVAPVRRALGVRTVFNLLGPMVNPAGARRGVLGVYAAELVPVVADALRLLGAEHTFVVHGGRPVEGEPHGGGGQAGGLDEFVLHAETRFAEVRGGAVRLGVARPEHFGLRAAPLEALAGGDAATNAAILRAIFAGEPGPRRDAVVMNAGAVLVAGGLADDFRGGAALAGGTIDSGEAQALLSALAPDTREKTEWHVSLA